MQTTKKRWVSRVVWIVFCLLLSAVSVRQTKAATYSGICGRNAKWNYNKKSKTLTISGKGAAVLNRRKKGYLEADIKPNNLVVKQGITSIICYNNYHKFCYNEFKLNQVSLPNSLRSIQGPLFMNCKIVSLSIPKNVKRLDAIPFLFANIKKFKINKKNKYFTVSSEGILFSKNRKTLLYYPKNCKQKKYDLPGSVSKIGQMAFYGNCDLRDVVLTRRIKKIGNGAFAYCNNLKKINIQLSKVKQIQDYDGKKYGIRRYFGHWILPELRGKEYDEYEEESTTLFERVCGYFCNKTMTYNYPDNINYFGTFQGTRLQSFVMPDSMKYAGKQTFYPDRNYRLYPVKYYELDVIASGGTLKKLVIGKNFCGEINGGKFGLNDRKTTLDLYFTKYIRGYENEHFQLKSIQVHKKNKKYRVQNHVLYSKNLDTIYMASNMIPANFTAAVQVRYIARGAFYANQSVRSITFPGAVDQIHESAFEECINLKTAKFMSTIDKIGQYAFDRNNKMVFTGNKIHYIDAMAFRWGKSVAFDSSELVYIGTQAFQSCGISLGSLKLDGPLEYIGTMAFCHAVLKTIEIHSTKPLTVGDGAFSGTHISEASITSDVSLNLGNVVFNVCNYLKKILLSKGTVIKGNVLIRLYTDYELQYL